MEKKTRKKSILLTTIVIVFITIITIAIIIGIAAYLMNVIKEIYSAESVYLCTMCDGPMNHFHIQLIPRYSFEKRGSKNFVKERKEYIEDTEKIKKMRELLKT